MAPLVYFTDMNALLGGAGFYVEMSAAALVFFLIGLFALWIYFRDKK